MSPPFPTVPVTVDIIIENLKGDKIVLIERNDEPKGVAIPGGFVEPGESLAQAAVREAKEETGLDVELVEQFYAYSKPGRDPRGPVCSVVFIAKAIGMPKGGDDAKTAGWVDFEITSSHYSLRIPYRYQPSGSWDIIPIASLVFDHHEILRDYANYKRAGNKPGLER